MSESKRWGPLLAVDTSSLRSSIAIRDSSGAVHHWSGNGQTASHNEELTSEITGLMARVGLRYEDLSGLIFGNGPGSFTGLRIGLSVLKGLAVGLKIPLIAHSSLEAIGHEAKEIGELVTVVSDARRGELFVLFMEKVEGGALRAIGEPSIQSPQAVVELTHKLALSRGISVGAVVVAAADPVPAMAYGGDLSVFHSHRSVYIARSLLELPLPPNNGFSLSRVAAIEPEYLRAVAAKTIAERENLAT